MLTLQEVFDKAATHLLKQGVRCENEYTCLYRGPNGTMCAVGALIDDAYYSASLEMLPADSYLVLEALMKSGVPTVDAVELLLDLQRVHDEEMPDRWGKALLSVAANYGLDGSAVKRAL